MESNIKNSRISKDIARYWELNGDLAASLQDFWGPTSPCLQKVFPVRFYEDGADTIGINAFELLSMISVAPQHSSSMLTRFVFLGFSMLKDFM